MFLKVELRSSHVVGKYSATKPHPMQLIGITNSLLAQNLLYEIYYLL